MIIEMFERGILSTCKNVTHDIKLSHHSRDIWGQSLKMFDDIKLSHSRKGQHYQQDNDTQRYRIKTLSILVVILLTV